MKIGVVSDTHIHGDKELDTFKEIFSKHFSHVDLVFHAGDLVNIRVFEWLNEQVETVAVSGNMDFPEVCEILPRIRIVEAGEFRIGLTHGQGPPSGLVERIKMGFEDMEKESELDCIVYGHTHWTVNRVVNGTLFFNPGTPTDTKFAPYNSIGFLEINDKIEGTIKRI